MSEAIFINYRRDDTIATAGRLNDRLARSFTKSRVFMDLDQIPAGADFVDYIENRLSECGVLLALIGPRWLDVHSNDGSRRLDDPSDFVVNEIAAAFRQGVDIIPVLVDGTNMPAADILPDSLKFLARRNAVELRNVQFGSDVRRLNSKIRQVLKNRRVNRWAVENCDKSLGPAESGMRFSGIYVGTVEDQSGHKDVQVKLVRRGQVVKGSYYRGGICGEIVGELIEERMLFSWNWADNSGRGVAIQEGDILTATSGLNENIEGLTNLVLLLQTDS